jgi:hypothetical protein
MNYIGAGGQCLSLFKSDHDIRFEEQRKSTKSSEQPVPWLKANGRYTPQLQVSLTTDVGTLYVHAE